MEGASLIPPFGVRMPPDLRQWVAEQARVNGSSQNSEVIRAIRERKEREDRQHEEQTRD